MKRSFLLIISCFLFGCSMSGKMMSSDEYAMIDVGMSVHQMEKAYGKPNHIFSKESGIYTYEYTEKIIIQSQVIEQRNYYIVVEGKKVVGKYMKVFTPPAFDAIYSEDPYPNY